MSPSPVQASSSTSIPPLVTGPAATACGYVRGSTDEQQDTLTAQAGQIQRYCEFRGFSLVHQGEEEGETGRQGGRANSPTLPLSPSPTRCFIDSGTSAFSVPFYERPVAGGMVTWMQEQGVKNLILTKLDRGFRNTLDCLFTIQDLNAKGIAIHILDMQLDTSTSIGKFVLTVMAGVAELENERRSERQRDVFKVRKAQNRRCGTIPYGQRLKEGSDDQFEPDPYEQAILARILTGDLATCSANEAARRLNAAGIPAKRGGAWFPATVNNLRQRNAVML